MNAGCFSILQHTNDSSRRNWISIYFVISCVYQTINTPDPLAYLDVPTDRLWSVVTVVTGGQTPITGRISSRRTMWNGRKPTATVSGTKIDHRKYSKRTCGVVCGGKTPPSECGRRGRDAPEHFGRDMERKQSREGGSPKTRRPAIRRGAKQIFEIAWARLCARRSRHFGNDNGQTIGARGRDANRQFCGRGEWSWRTTWRRCEISDGRPAPTRRAPRKNDRVKLVIGPEIKKNETKFREKSF